MHALEIKGLTKVYPNGFTALKGIDIEVEQGDFCALLGPNGAGKTTTIGIVTSLVSKTSGSVRVFGNDIDTNLSAAKQCIGLVPQEINLNLFEKVQNTLMHQAGYYGIPRRVALERVEKYLSELKLWDRRNDISRNLSGGMKRRLMIARALVHEPRLLILDEPTAGVDIEIRRSMWSFLQNINANGTTIILTTHYLEEAETLCRNIAIIDKGEIVEDTSMAELLRKLKREVFVLSTREALEAPPSLPEFEVALRPDGDLEVTMQRAQSLNRMFAALGERGVTVESMRNKSNRLEELFMNLVESKQSAEAAHDE
ncbi:MAG: ABC transporter ATP-binding protein [Pseudomonadota bacterium]